MKKYYIIRPDGTSIFALPYPEDFCIHCLFLLQNDGQRYKLLSAAELSTSLSAFKSNLLFSVLPSPGRIAGGEMLADR